MSNYIIKVYKNGDFKNTKRAFKKFKNLFAPDILNKYGKLGVDLLREYTPKDTGLTSESWYYEINETQYGPEIVWKNYNVTENDIVIAYLIQYGHATVNGGWVEGRDYINPALNKLFDIVEEDAKRELL